MSPSRWRVALLCTACLVAVGHARIAPDLPEEWLEAARVFDELPSLLQITSETRQRAATPAPAPRMPTIPEDKSVQHAAPSNVAAQAVNVAQPEPVKKMELPTFTATTAVPGCTENKLLMEAVPAALRNLHWLEVKTNGLRELQQDYFDLRSFYVPCMLVLVLKDKCKACKAQSVGTVSVTSDADFTIKGPNAAAVVDSFNAKFFKIWKRTSADVFDTNMYGIGWLDEEGVWTQALSGRLPNCYEKVPNVPDGNISPMVPGADIEADQAMQHQFAYAKIRYFARQAFIAIYGRGSLMTIDCDGPFDDIRNNVVCHGVHHWVTNLRRYLGYRLSEADTTDVWKTSRAMFLNQWNASALLLQELLTDPCKQPSMQPYCIKEGSATVIDMNSIEGRNLLYGESLKKIYGYLVMTPPKAGQASIPRKVPEAVSDSIRAPAGGMPPLPARVMQRRDTEIAWPQPGQCLQLKKDISTAMFYGIETYWTKGTYLDVVVKQQMGEFEPEYRKLGISFAEYFDSFLENCADLLKVLTEGAHHKWDPVYTTVESSKYAFRMMLAASTLLNDLGAAAKMPQLLVRNNIMDPSKLAAAPAVAARTPPRFTTRRQLVPDPPVPANAGAPRPATAPRPAGASTLNPAARPFVPSPAPKAPVVSSNLNPKAAPFVPSNLNPPTAPFQASGDKPLDTDGARSVESAVIKARNDIVTSIECLRNVAKDIKSKLRGKAESEEIKQMRETFLTQISKCYKAILDAYVPDGYDSDNIFKMPKSAVLQPDSVLPLTMTLSIAHPVIAYYLKNHVLGFAKQMAKNAAVVDNDVFEVLQHVYPKPNSHGRRTTGPQALRASVSGQGTPADRRGSNAGSGTTTTAAAAAAAATPLSPQAPRTSSAAPSVATAAATPVASTGQARRSAYMPPKL